MFSRDQCFGQAGEDWALGQLQKRGYKPILMHDFQTKACDMKIGDLCIEVKIALLTYRARKTNFKGLKVYYPRWQWYIHPTYKNLNEDWVLILIAQDNKLVRYPYILPGGMLQGRTHVQITSHPKKYSGWLADWRDEWGVIDFLRQKSYLDNGPTYHQWKAGQRILA